MGLFLFQRVCGFSADSSCAACGAQHHIWDDLGPRGGVFPDHLEGDKLYGVAAALKQPQEQKTG